MESSVVAEMAGQAAMPFVTVRVALDEVAFSLPDVSWFFRLWRERRLGSIVSYGAEEPSRVLDLVRVWRYSRYASGRLAAFLFDVLSELSRSPDGARQQG